MLGPPLGYLGILRWIDVGRKLVPPNHSVGCSPLGMGVHRVILKLGTYGAVVGPSINPPPTGHVARGIMVASDGAGEGNYIV